MKISKSWIFMLFIFILIVLLFNVFALTGVSREVTFVLIATSTVGYCLLLFNLSHLDKYLLKWVIIYIILFIISISVAYIKYNQSVISGLVANLNIYFIGTVILISYLLNNVSTKYEIIEIFVRSMSLIVIVVYLYLFLSDYEYINISEFSGNQVIVHYGKLNKSLISFLGIAWFGIYLKTGKYRHIFYGLIILSLVHLYDLRRFDLVVSVGSIFLFSMATIKYRSSAKLFGGMLMLILIGLWLLVYLLPEQMQDIQEAFKIFTLDPASIQDSSTRARVFQIYYALSSISDNFLLGTGQMRESEKELFVGNEYFYPVDIGIIGIMFVFGLLGIILYIYKGKTIVNIVKNYTKDSSVILTVYLIYLFLETIVRGTIIFHPSLFVLMLVLLNHSKKRYIRLN